jgi:hypothetical protein
MFFEISKIKDIENQIEENSLIAFDLDNTLITSSSYYGSINWEDNLISKLKKEGLTQEEAHKQASNIWKQAQFEIKHKLIEKESSKLIKNWKKKSHIIGLTARSFDIKELTFESLKTNKITFSSYIDHNLDRFHEGILFCANFLKSTLLTNFINQVLKTKPTKIIVVDDKIENLDDILKSDLSKNYNVRCYHYLNDPYLNEEIKS